MVWQGANVDIPQDVPTDNPVDKHQETVEAALNRLSKAYTAAMNCVGALHRTPPDDRLQQIKLGRAARQTFEQAILLDSLVAYEHAPLLRETLNISNIRTIPKVELRSAGHRSTVEQLAYLSLVNYADLLLSGCRSSIEYFPTLLDRGLVKAFSEFSTGTCWIRATPTPTWTEDLMDAQTIGEDVVDPIPSKIVEGSEDSLESSSLTMARSTEALETSASQNCILHVGARQSMEDIVDEEPEREATTVRLALAAYVDATRVDSTDPTVWLKLACAARRLGRLVSNIGSSSTFLRYHCLERHALEQAFLTLPTTLPPNRIVNHMLEQWCKEANDFTLNPYHACRHLGLDDTENVNRKLSIPRYSWSTVGRLLLKACNDGSTATVGYAEMYIRLELSPFLTVPPVVLENICVYLTSPEISCLEATCRALSASIVCARASLDHKAEKRDYGILRKFKGSKHIGVGVGVVDTKRKFSDGDVGRNPASRASKRLRSQIINSGKRSERCSRRTSVEYCVIAAVLGCSSEGLTYQEATCAEFDWNTIPILYGHSYRLRLASLDTQSRNVDIVEDESLANFVGRWLTRASTPLSILFDFMAYVSVHVTEIFVSDLSGSNNLSELLLKCFDFLSNRLVDSYSFLPIFSKSKWRVPHTDHLYEVELFAMDLLHAELSFRKCQQDDSLDLSFNGKCNFVSRMAPYLASLIHVVEVKIGSLDDKARLYDVARLWVQLKVRCYWLNAGVFLWRSSFSDNHLHSCETENAALEHLEMATICLTLPKDRPVCKVSTPHLASRNRRGQHWNELTPVALSMLRNEVQATSILSRAQEKFLDVAIQIASSDKGDLSESHIDALIAISDMLHARYCSADGSTAASFRELVVDFIGEHGESLTEKAIAESRDDGNTSIQEWFDSIAPTSQLGTPSVIMELRRPCILTIMLHCLQAKRESKVVIEKIIVDLILALADITDEMRSEVPQSSVIDFLGHASDEDSLENSQFDCHSKIPTKYQRTRIQQYAVLLRLLVDRLACACEGNQKVDRADSTFALLLHRLFIFLTFWCDWIDMRNIESLLWAEDHRLFRSVRRLFQAGCRTHLNQDPREKEIIRTYLVGLMTFVKHQRDILASYIVATCDRTGRAIRAKAMKYRAEITGSICCELGLLLSEFPCEFREGTLVRSHIFCESGQDPFHGIIAASCESLLWLWGSLSQNETSQTIAQTYTYKPTLDQACSDRLRIPVACALLGLVGSCTGTCPPFCLRSQREEKIEIADFYDSDTSTINYIADLVEDEIEPGETKRAQLLSVICRVVNCVANLFGQIEDREAILFDNVSIYCTVHGPALPLIACRVLNRVADRLLLEFCEKDGKASLWSDYSFGTRTVGRQLDSLLHRCYKCLYGFSILSPSDGKDTVGSSANYDVATRNRPENLDAVVWLYRCLMRAYSQGRRSPPKQALEIIIGELPPLEECPRAQSIRRFIFSSFEQERWLSLEELRSFLIENDDRGPQLVNVDTWLFHATDASLESEDELRIIRRGVSDLIAHGTISPAETVGNDVRASTVHNEEELSRKFLAIVDGLILGDSLDYEAWFKASQCLTNKAELIADRLGLSKGFARCSDFSPNSSSFRKRSEREKCPSRWIGCLGTDLSVYIRYSWSSFESLGMFVNEIASTFEGDTKSSSPVTAAGQFLHEIEGLRLKSDLVAWQEAWGGQFVYALRNMALRCAHLSLYILFKQERTEASSLLISEIAEALGIMLYTEISCAQVYGYPMHTLGCELRREIAQKSLSCFQRAVFSAESSLPDHQLRPTWDLKMMIGKCHEKIAKSFLHSNFEPSITRLYETHMNDALQAYFSSLQEAKILEYENDLLVELSGGSSHGSTEVVYRLHASRLKCLINAFNREEEERELAECEALRLTERYWYAGRDSPCDSIRDRVWNVLVDVVTALAQCKLDFPFFHRSVYRHAQALMWAPRISDPSCHRSSLGSVSASRAFKLRGLNSSDATSSALAVMSSLFEKKRAQLCAVWVTSDPSQTAYQAINNSVRKYDSLRGKYINAYLECLRLCKRRNELEVFLRWTNSTKRDLPYYFAASACPARYHPVHSKDALTLDSLPKNLDYFLMTVKRQANTALAQVIVEEVEDFDAVGEKDLEDLLKLAYACFLRLNCHPNEITPTMLVTDDAVKAVSGALTAAYLRCSGEPLPSGQPSGAWGCESQIKHLFYASLKKSKELFPNLSGSFYTKKAISRARDEEEATNWDTET